MTVLSRVFPPVGFGPTSTLRASLRRPVENKEEAIARKVAIQVDSARNVCNVAGYLPVLGILAGASRIFVAVHDNEGIASAAEKAGHIFRGVLEILGLGLLFLIPDLVASVVYACQEPVIYYKPPVVENKRDGFKPTGNLEADAYRAVYGDTKPLRA